MELSKEMLQLTSLYPDLCEEYNRMIMEQIEAEPFATDCYIMITFVHTKSRYHNPPRHDWSYIFTWYNLGDVDTPQGQYKVHETEFEKELYYFPLLDIDLMMQLVDRHVEFAEALTI